MQLNILTEIPPGFLETDSRQLYELLDGPTLIILPGKHAQPVMVSTLLHGNETTGFYALQELLRKHQGRELPRSLAIFIGNVEAARNGLRRLDNQVDYNRIWSHQGYNPEGIEADIMRQVVSEMRQRQVFLSIDIHNNTGLNPHYACVNRLEQNFYKLATLFSRTVIYFIQPDGVQSQAFAELCPAVTIECGKTDNRSGIDHAREYIEACLHLSELPVHDVTHNDIDLFHTMAIVKVPEDISFSFTQAADIVFDSQLEKYNFSELAPHTIFARVKSGLSRPLQVVNEQGEHVFEKYFQIEDGHITTKTNLMPSMLTTEEDIIRKDCLCYIMERMPPIK